ncbi:Nn.00g101690.m01.CDS01 [Neocucurbitaria sp. VM-36]
MVEFIGAAAAIPQLAKYTFSAVNTVPDLMRKVRKAPITQRQWDDQAILLASLSERFHLRPSSTSTIPPVILDRIDDDLNNILPFLRNTTIDTSDGRLARIRKKIAIVRRESEMNRDFSVVTQRSMLYSQLLVLESFDHDLNSAKVQLSSDLATTLNDPQFQISSGSQSPQSRFFVGSNSRQPNFIGQKQLLRILCDTMGTSLSSIVALSGLGGTGKSELVAEFAYLRHATSPDTPIFWLDASTEASLLAGLRHIGQYAHILEANDQSIAEVGKAVITWLDLEASGPWIVIVDNAEYGLMSTDLHSWLVAKPRGHVLLITRSRLFALKYVHPTDLVEMPRMSAADAQELLCSYMGTVIGNKEDLVRIVRHLECNPFALKQAGLYMSSTSSGPATCLAMLESDKFFLSRLLTCQRDHIRTSPNPRAFPNPFYSLDIIAALNQDVQAVLFILICIDSSRISDEVAGIVVDGASKQQALDLLRSYYIIVPGASGDIWQIPTLVRITARTQMLNHPSRVQYLEAALRLIASIDRSHVTGRRNTHRHRAHEVAVLEMLTTCASEHEVSQNSVLLAIELATKLCQSLVLAGEAKRAIQSVCQLISWAPARITNQFSSFYKLRSKLGAAQHSQGLLTDAESITKEVLWSQVYTIGEDHIDTLHTLNNMGVIHHDQGRFPIAESYHRKALEMKHRIFGGQHLETLLTLNNLALALESQSKHDDAEKLFRRALRGRRRLLPSDHIDILVSISNLGVQLQIRGSILESQKLHEAALLGRERILGERHPETLKSKGNLALALSSQGQHEQSNKMLRQVCDAYKVTLGASHPDTIKSLRNLTIALHRHSRLSEAEEVLTELLETLEKKHGKGHVRTFGTLQHLATLLHLQNKLDEAFEIVTWLFKIRVEVLGDGHSDTACSRDHKMELEEDLLVRSRCILV